MVGCRGFVVEEQKASDDSGRDSKPPKSSEGSLMPPGC